MARKAESSHTFEIANMDHFAAFADFMQEALTDADIEAEVTFIETPMFGKPYVQINFRDIEQPMDSWTLMLDEGQTLNIGHDVIGRTEAWITGGVFDE